MKYKDFLTLLILLGSDIIFTLILMGIHGAKVFWSVLLVGFILITTIKKMFKIK